MQSLQVRWSHICWLFLANGGSNRSMICKDELDCHIIYSLNTGEKHSHVEFKKRHCKNSKKTQVIKNEKFGHFIVIIPAIIKSHLWLCNIDKIILAQTN